MLLAIFLTWLLGFTIVFLYFITLAIEADHDLDKEFLLYIFFISIWSWIYVIIYLYYWLEEKFKNHE